MKAAKKRTIGLSILLLIVFISVCTVASVEMLSPFLEEPISTQELTTEPTKTTIPEPVSLVALTLGNTSDSPMAVGIPVEYDFWGLKSRAPFQDASAPQTMTVTFNGESYTGSYQSSHILPPNTFQEDDYYIDGECLFTVNAETGELTGFLPMDLKSIQEGNETVEACRSAALAFAAQQFGDLSQFRITSSEGLTPTFQFVRYIGDMKTAEIFVINVSNAGNICGFSSMMLGCFGNGTQTLTLSTEKTESVALLASTKATDILEAKMQDIYATIGKRYTNMKTFSYEIKDSWLVPLPDGTMGTLYNTVMYLHNAEGESMYSSLIQVLVKCEPSSGHEVS